MLKHLVASVAIVLLGMSTAGAQAACYPGANTDLAGVIGSTIGALIGSSIGDGRGQTVATGTGALLGGVIGASLSQRRTSVYPEHAVVQQLNEQRNQVINSAVTGQIPMPRKTRSVRRQQQILAHCQEIQPGTFACLDSNGTWRVIR